MKIIILLLIGATSFGQYHHTVGGYINKPSHDTIPPLADGTILYWRADTTSFIDTIPCIIEYVDTSSWERDYYSYRTNKRELFKMIDNRIYWERGYEVREYVPMSVAVNSLQLNSGFRHIEFLRSDKTPFPKDRIAKRFD